MPTLSVDTGAQRVLEHLEYSLLRLDARKDTKQVAEGARPYYEALAAAIPAERRARQARIGANAILNYLDREVLDVALALVETLLLGLVANDEDHPLFQDLFGRATRSQIARMPIAKELLEVDRIVAALGKPGYETLAVHREDLQAAAVEVRQAMTDRDACLTSESEARSKLEMARSEGLREYNYLETALKGLNRHKPRTKAYYDTFFPPRRDSESPEPAEPSRPTDPPAA